MVAEGLEKEEDAVVVEVMTGGERNKDRSKWEISVSRMPYHWSPRHVADSDTILCPTYTTT